MLELTEDNNPVIPAADRPALNFRAISVEA